MNPNLKKWVVRPLIVAGSVLAIIIITGFFILSTQQERLVNLAISEVNKQLKGELIIGESSIALFKHFPHVSVGLYEGRFMPDKSKNSPAILEFDQLFIGFSLSDIINEKYDIKKILLQGGRLDLVQEADGTLNLVEAQRREETPVNAVAESSSDSATVIELEKITVKQLNVSFVDKASGQKFVSRIEDLSSSLKLDSVQMALKVGGEMEVDIFNSGDSVLFRDKRVLLNLVADYQLEPRLFDITDCSIKLEDASFNVRGYAHLNDTTEIDFRVKGDRQDFNLFRAFLPVHVKEKLKPFEYDGKLHFDAQVSGKVAEGIMPHINVEFGCEEAWFLNTGANKKVDQLGFKGHYSNGPENSLKTSELRILNISARPERGVFRGHFVLRDFTEPKALVKINSELELKFLGEFLGIPDLTQMTGQIKLDMDFKEVHDITLPEESLNKLKEGIQSKLIVEDLSFRIPGYPHAVREMNIHAAMKDGRVTVDSASLKIGESDLKFNGSISDVRAFLREREKAIKLTLNATSKQMVLANLLSYDTALARRWNEEVQGFNINLAFETTVKELLNPSPLPRGVFEMKNLRGKFKNYAHTVRDVGATLQINDTLLRLRDFTGIIDSSDINFKGRIINYHLWFDDIKTGKTQIAFDFKSSRFALRDVFGREIRKHLPRGYRREELNNVWLRAKVDLRYDTSFRFAKAKVVNVTADLKKHNLKLHGISGGVKYGSRILSFDTLRGKIGNSDFDINLKYYFKGIDRNNNQVANSLKFTSKFLDADEMSKYDLAPKTGKVVRDSTGRVVAVVPDSSHHAKAFNIFSIPFSEFGARVEIGKLKYNRLWLKDVHAEITMRKDQTITVDTLTLKVAGGAVAMRGKFNGSNPEKIYFRSRIRFDQVDLEKMMLKLDHFGQDVVVNKNVKGRISGHIKSYVQVHPDLVPIMSNSRAEMTLSIYNGTLVDFAPMQAMAGYFKDKNLRLIRFDTLSNKLTFTNGVLDIPAMNINSSLGYIQMSGRQSLDLSMEYYVRVPMKMVTKVGFSALFNRKPEEVDLNQVDEIEYIDKERKIAFMNLKVTGTPGKYEVGLGKEKGNKL